VISADKPRYTIKEGKLVMAQDIAPASKFALPAHLQGKPKIAGWGDIDRDHAATHQILKRPIPKSSTTPASQKPASSGTRP
jgi:hypothetical protein